jgi:uncharacterized protein (TIGR02453 family)
MNYFTKEFISFYKELAANNNRDWFQLNRKRYETHVKQTMEVFVADLIAAIAKHDKAVAGIRPGDAMFRINRDIRFSKDKTPYKTYSSAAVSASGKKVDGEAGLYVELGPEKVGLAGGIYMPDKEGLMDIRDAMAKQPKAFIKALHDPTFKKMWGVMQGEKNKVIAPEHKEVAEEIPYIYHKQFYFWKELPAKHVTSAGLLDLVMEHYVAAKPVSKLLNQVLRNH